MNWPWRRRENREQMPTAAAPDVDSVIAQMDDAARLLHSIASDYVMLLQQPEGGSSGEQRGDA